METRSQIPDSLIPIQGEAPIQENTMVDIVTIHPVTSPNMYDDIYTVRLREYLGHDLQQVRLW